MLTVSRLKLFDHCSQTRHHCGHGIILDLVTVLELNWQYDHKKKIHRKLNTIFHHPVEKNGSNASVIGFNVEILVFNDESKDEIITVAGFFCSNYYPESNIKLNDTRCTSSLTSNSINLLVAKRQLWPSVVPSHTARRQY